MRRKEACNGSLAKARSVAASIQKAFLALCLALLLVPAGALIEPGAFAEEDEAEQSLDGEMLVLEDKVEEANESEDEGVEQIGEVCQERDEGNLDSEFDDELELADEIATEKAQSQEETIQGDEAHLYEARANEATEVIFSVTPNKKMVIDLSNTSQANTYICGVEVMISWFDDAPEWDAISDSEKYDASHFSVTSSNESVATAQYLANGSPTGRPGLIITGHANGSSDISISYEFGKYKGSYSVGTVYVTNQANPVTGLQATASTWTLKCLQTPSGWKQYISSVDNQPQFGLSNYDMGIFVETQNPDCPSTIPADELFDISINGNAVSRVVISPVVGDGVEKEHHLYTVVLPDEVQPGSATVTVSLKSNPAVSTSFIVNVAEDYPQLSVRDETAETGSTYTLSFLPEVEIGAIWSGFFPDECAGFTSEYIRAYNPGGLLEFIQSATSSDSSVVKVERAYSPSAYEFVECPYAFTALKEGVADITLTDITGKSYTFKITAVHNEKGDLNIVESVSLDNYYFRFDTNELNGVVLTATVIKKQDVPVTVKWFSEDESIVRIERLADDKVRVVPVSQGSSFVTVESGGCGSRCRFVVTPALTAGSTEASDLQGEISLPVAPDDATKAELEEIALEVSKKPLAPQETIDAAKDKFADEGHAVLGVYEIHFVNKDDGTIHNWNKPGFPMDVRILMDDQMKALAAKGQLTIWHLDEATGERVKMETWIEGDYLVFRTTHFSSYVLVHTPFPVDPVDGIAPELTSVGDAPAKGTPLAQTGDDAPLLPLMLMSIGLAAIGIFSFRKVRCNG